MYDPIGLKVKNLAASRAFYTALLKPLGRPVTCLRQVNRVEGPNGDREIAEVTELIAIGAGSVWRSIGDLIGTERPR